MLSRDGRLWDNQGDDEEQERADDHLPGRVLQGRTVLEVPFQDDARCGPGGGPGEDDGDGCHIAQVMDVHEDEEAGDADGYPAIFRSVSLSLRKSWARMAIHTGMV